MKKIFPLLVGVLMCTLVSAHGTKDKPTPASSSVAVTHANGSSLVKLYYKAEKLETVDVSILNDKNEIVFNEALRKTDYFIRPYNFSELAEGEYTFIIRDEFGKTVEKVSYKNERVEKLIHIAKLAEVNKYLISIMSRKPEDVFIYIFDENGALIHNEIQTISKEFAQVYNLTDIKSFTLEVWDKNGELKRYASY